MPADKSCEPGVDEKYLELIAEEPLYHNDLYVELLKLNKQSLFPKKYLSQEFFAISDLANSKENTRDGFLPDCFEFLDKREVANGDNKGVYYFYDAKYSNSEDAIVLEISGPQPLQLKEFVLKGKKTNKIYNEQIRKEQINQRIDEIIRTLTD